jgi:flagellar basal body P-ring protein FlgI
VCDISIEGADLNETEARIIIESKDWTLMFKGSLKNGKCIVPVKKLNILQEGQTGKIRLEVIAEGNLFVPWEDDFKVKVSKKVTVKVNEQKENRTRNGVSVKVKR